ncbi:MAG TPA: hypothetical protein H9668_07765 [Firmicutes bacterium]|nr:hypothetical protein [Bacillota bacterium]
MRKNLLLFMVLLAFVLGCTAACGNPGGGVSSTSQPVSASARDRTVDLADAVETAGKRIQGAYTTADRLKIYETIPDLAGDAAGIVRGDVLEVSYFHIGTVAYTKMDLEVTESLYGDFVPGDTISVYKSGGYIPMADYLPDIQERFPEITDQEVAGTVVDVSNEGDPHPAAGQDLVVFLYTSENEPEPLTDMYGIIGDYAGQFTQGADGQFARHIAQIPAQSTEGGPVQYSLESEEPLDRTGLTGADGVFTYDALKTEIQAALQ